MTDYHSIEVGFLRYFFAWVPLAAYTSMARRKEFVRWARGFERVDLYIIAVGVLTFFLSPVCQMKGLNLSRAVDSSLMIALEPLITIIAAAVIFKERITGRFVFSIVLALAGVAIVTELNLEKLLTFKDARLIGNLLMLVSLASEAAYSMFAKPVLEKPEAPRDPVIFMTVALTVGVALLGAYNIAAYGTERLCGLSVLVHSGSVVHWGTAFYLGVACTAFAYFAWLMVLKQATVSAMAMTLYVQPVLGIFWGAWFLHESLNVFTLVGGALILFAVWLGSHTQSKSTVT